MAATTSKTAFRPAAENLGDRTLLTAGLVANLDLLANGTYELIVQGTDADDTIAVHQVGPQPGVFYPIRPTNQLFVDGVDSIAVKDRNLTTVRTITNSVGIVQCPAVDLAEYTVSKITVNADDGDDVVTFDTANDFATSSRPITIPVVVNGNAGNDDLSGAAGSTTLNGGVGDDVLAAASGASTLNGNIGNDTLFGGSANCTLSGNDGDDVLQAMTGTATLNGGNGNDGLFGGFGTCTLHGEAGDDYLSNSSGKATFDGGAGLDYYYDARRAGAVPFVTGASFDDLRQSDTGAAGATLAAIGALMYRGHDFTRDVSYLGDSTYGVYVGEHTPANYHLVTFDGHWTDNDANPLHADNDVWALLVTRARYQTLGIDPSVYHSAAEWQASGALNETFAVSDLTGRAATTSPLSGTGAISPSGLQTALDAGRSAVARSKSSPPGSAIPANQAFGVRNVTLRADGVYVVTLYNPTGKDGSSSLDLNLPGNAYRDDGEITLTWTQFVNNFQSVGVA